MSLPVSELVRLKLIYYQAGDQDEDGKSSKACPVSIHPLTLLKPEITDGGLRSLFMMTHSKLIPISGLPIRHDFFSFNTLVGEGKPESYAWGWQ